MADISRADWVDATLATFAERGLAGIDLRSLEIRLGAPENGFHEHFSSRDELVRAMLDHWRTSFTEGSIALLKEVAEPAERLRLLLNTALTEWAGTPSDRAAMAEAGTPVVAEALRKVHDLRIDYITEQYEQPGFPPERARARAVLAYAPSLGLIGLRPMYGEMLGFDLDEAVDALSSAPERPGTG